MAKAKGRGKNDEKRLKIMFVVLGVLAALFVVRTIGIPGGGGGGNDSSGSTTPTTVVGTSTLDDGATVTTVAPEATGDDDGGGAAPRNPFEAGDAQSAPTDADD